MRDYYQEMRDACADIVKQAARDIQDPERFSWCIHLDHVLEMAKWVSMDRSESVDAAKEAVAKGIGDALLKAVAEDQEQGRW